MRGLASYNIIERKLNISNPFQFFSELKYHIVEDVYENICSVLKHSDYDALYETVLRELSDWKGLISNDKGIRSERYLNDLDMCLHT